jgi:hypothetical protein
MPLSTTEVSRSRCRSSAAERTAGGGKAPCRQWREARALARKGLPFYTNLCERRVDEPRLPMLLLCRL